MALWLGCGAEPAPDADLDTVAGGHASRLGRDLSRGATGDDVAELNGYLGRYGYLPNSDLSADYPRWRPLLWESPPDLSVFDAITESAVSALQLRAGLAQTGTVAGDTRTLVEGVRCGVPEGVATLDRRSKFAHNGSTWSKASLSWRITAFPAEPSEALVRAAIQAAFASWQAETDLQFQPATTGGADIDLAFTRIDGPGKTLASARFPERGGDITFDADERWSVDAASPGTVDVQSVALHQIGHSLGLTHVDVQSAAMYAYYRGTKRDLHSDDRQGISALYDTWVARGGEGAVDVAVSARGDVWAVLTPMRDGQPAHRVGTSWEMSYPTEVVNIAVSPDGTPWITDTRNAMLRREGSGSDAQWVAVPGCAIDVAVGANGDVWSIGCEQPVSGGGIPQKWTGVAWQSVNSGQRALRIAVDSHGFPWIVANDKRVFRRTSADPLAGAWQELPGAMNDLGIGPQDQVWGIGTTPTIGSSPSAGTQYKMYAWSSAPTGALDRVDGEWLPLVGAGTRISAGPDGTWATASGQVWQQVAVAQ